jgi:metacaspase-1
MARGISINVGINNVDASVYGSPLTLRGCENDARSMWAIADAAGFDMAASKLILSRDATAQAVSGAIRNAASELDMGDLLFLTYSGHGGQVPDPTGEEIDARNETWVLYDRQLIDDELNELWALFPSAARIFVLSDSCHSGTVVRDVDGRLYDSTRQATLNSLPIVVRDMVGLEDAQPVTKELPFDVQESVYYGNKELYDSLPRTKDSIPVAASVMLESGCQDNQVSLDGAVNGLFTEKLLAVWQSGAFSGDYESFHQAIGSFMPPTQSPNFYAAGTPSPPFQRQKPLTISAPASAVSPTPQAGTWMDRLQLAIDDLRKEKDMTSTMTAVETPAQEKWLELIPTFINIGMQALDALNKEGFQLEDSSGQKVLTTKDVAEGEKWFQFIPLAIDLGLQVYDALNKEGALPADKQVTLPKDFSPDAMKGWLDLVPIAIDLGTDCFNFLMEKGFVSSSANLPQAPQLDDAEAKGWLDLIPVALSTGQQILDALTKEAGQLPTMTKGVGAGAPSATKEVVRSFSQQILNQSGGS